MPKYFPQCLPPLPSTELRVGLFCVAIMLRVFLKATSMCSGTSRRRCEMHSCTELPSRMLHEEQSSEPTLGKNQTCLDTKACVPMLYAKVWWSMNSHILGTFSMYKLCLLVSSWHNPNPLELLSNYWWPFQICHLDTATSSATEHVFSFPCSVSIYTSCILH